MAYTNGFPVGYQPFNPYMQMNNPYMQQVQQMPQMQQPTQQPQAMTPPTIHADIIQVENEAEADRYPMAANQPPQMFMTRDESAIFVKTMLANNQHDLTAYIKRPPTPPTPPVDLAAYVTRQELDERLAALLQTAQTSKRTTKKEGEE